MREAELTSIIQQNKLNLVFLVETDTNAVNNEADYKIKGFKTVIQNKNEESRPTRIIGLIDENLSSRTIIRNDLTSPDFPSIWVELENNQGANTVCGGFYREWAPKGIDTIEAQVKAMEVFTSQIENAAAENKNLILLGDANLCSEKWDSPTFTHKRISDELRETLAQCGLKHMYLGKTYLADRLTPEGQEIESSIDHIYASNSISNKLRTFKLENSATDHLPIIASFLVNKPKISHSGSKIPEYKRSLKNFTKTRWIDCLRARNWERLSQMTDINDQTAELNKEINLALDECAPYRLFKPRDHFKPGLSEKSKALMKERDATRKELSQANEDNKGGLRATYKKLRNRAISQMKIDTLERNSKRISEAKNEGEVWKVVNDITKPHSKTKIILKTQDGDITEDLDVATKLNKYFFDKIENLKANIDPEYIEDPLAKTKEKVKNKNLRFSLKRVTLKEVGKIMKSMSKKKSKGNDGVSQECLLLGQEVLAAPITLIINNSISTGVFPETWKEAIVVPILKKGDPTDPKNYRPVSCLAAASKVLEKAVCTQLTKFVEVHGLLPNSQHGFRAGRSTMSALSAMQKEWIRNSEEGLVTGILVWDLSAAFDTLDISLFLKKMSLYGADGLSLSWFRSFLTERTQRVRIGSSLSAPITLTSGVPQGGILSPIIFTLYTADMEMWLKNSKLTNFADDTETHCSSKSKIEVKNFLEEDAIRILKFMASNGLVANQTKTELLILNDKNKEESVLQKIIVGNAHIERTDATKLLGVIINDKQDWTNHYKSLRNALNHRLFVIRRVQRQIPKDKILSLVHSLWVSKLRYGLQLCTKVQTTHEETKAEPMKSLQLTQNRMLRALNGSKIKDKISTSTLLNKFKLLSVNQLAGQIKLTEVWKSLNVEGYPIVLEPYKTLTTTTTGLRPQPNRIFNDSSRLSCSKFSFHVDAARLWNLAPQTIKSADTLGRAKIAILAHCKTLPI